jgi:hypothetical protein
LARKNAVCYFTSIRSIRVGSSAGFRVQLCQIFVGDRKHPTCSRRRVIDGTDNTGLRQYIVILDEQKIDHEADDFARRESAVSFDSSPNLRINSSKASPIWQSVRSERAVTCPKGRAIARVLFCSFGAEPPRWRRLSVRRTMAVLTGTAPAFLHALSAHRVRRSLEPMVGNRRSFAPETAPGAPQAQGTGSDLSKRTVVAGHIPVPRSSCRLRVKLCR